MKKSIFVLFFFCMLSNTVAAHTILLKDGRTIQAEKVWEEQQGYTIDDVSLYGYKSAGIPANLLSELKKLRDQAAATKDGLFNNIERVIGRANVQKYKDTLETYFQKKDIVFYIKQSSTIGIEKNRVERIEYDQSVSSAAQLIEPSDTVTKDAIAKERADLSKQLHEYEQYRAKLKVGEPFRKTLRNEEQAVREKIQLLEQNPLRYFFYYHEDFLNIHLKLFTPEQCADICGGTPAQDAPLIETSEYKLLTRCFKRCTRRYQMEPKPTPTTKPIFVPEQTPTPGTKPVFVPQQKGE